MSLHSKELFHSNIIAWFCETYPQAARDALSRWVPRRDSNKHRIQREKQSLDLAIELPGLAPVIIENKVFAPPDESQLERYSVKSLGKDELHDPTFILLSLGDPNWQGSSLTSSTGVTWRYISYRNLAEAMAESIQEVSGFSGDLLRHYVSFISLLYDLVEHLASPGPHDPLDLPDATKQLLQPIRLSGAIEKFRYRSAAASIQRAMASVPLGATAIYNANFTTGLPLLDVFIQCRNGDSIGWQYQNQQWRLAVKTKLHSGKSAELKALRHKLVAESYLDWFDFSPLQQLVGRKTLSVPKKELKGEFNSYAPDFTYRYRKLPNLTMNELEALSRDYLTQAARWV
jgi:hypothetical protein